MVNNSTMKLYGGLLHITFVICNTLSIALLINAFMPSASEIGQRILFWISVVLVTFITYPKFKASETKAKYIMLSISVIIFIVSVVMAITL